MIDLGLGVDMTSGGGVKNKLGLQSDLRSSHRRKREPFDTSTRCELQDPVEVSPENGYFLGGEIRCPLYMNDVTALKFDGGNIAVLNKDFQVASVYTGLTGRLTEKIGLILRAGYGQALFATEDLVTGESNPGGFLGQVDLQYKQSDTIKITAGFNRSLSGAAIYKYMIDNNFYVESKATLARRWGFSVKGSVSLLSYGKAFEGDEDRNDTMIRAEAVASVAVTEWFVIALVKS